MVPISPDADSELTELFEELAQRSEGIEALDGGQRRAWVSGLLSAWRSDVVVDDPERVDREFLDYLSRAGSGESGSGDRGTGGDDLRRSTPLREAARILLHETSTALLDPTPQPTTAIRRAWLVTDRRRPNDVAVVVSVVQNGGEHSILASIEDGALADLQVSGTVDDLLGQEVVDKEAGDPAISVADLDPSDALTRLHHAWSNLQQRDASGSRDVTGGGSSTGDASSTSDDQVVFTDGLLANQIMVRADLVELGVDCDDLGLFRAVEGPALTFYGDLTSDEVADGNRWASEALNAALRQHTETLALDEKQDPSWQEPEALDQLAVPWRGPLDGLSRREQQALVYLEWADWVGALSGLVAARDEPLDGDAIVGLINANPHLTTGIEDDDREWVAYGFDVALAIWSDAGAIDDGRFAPGAFAGIIAAAQAAWGG